MISAKKIIGISATFLTMALAATLSGGTVQAQTADLGFSEEQATNGKTLYRELCQLCHGSSLANGQFGTPLRGSFFRDKWKGKSVGELLQFVYEKMPPDKVMSLDQDQLANLVAYILSRNDLLPGSTALSGDRKGPMAAEPLPFE